MTDKRKEYIKNFIIRAIEGKVKQSEIEKIRENLLSYSREEWRDLKIISQELAKEIIDEKISELPDKVSSEWKSIGQDVAHSFVNLFFAVFNEEVWYQSMILEKQTGLTKEQKIIKILPVISREMDKVAARGNSLKLSKDDYHKAEVSVVKKIKKVISEGKWIYFQEASGKRLSKAEWMEKAREFIKILESLTVEEIVVLKEKIKLFTNKLIDNYAPSQIKNSPEIRQFINSFVNLYCATNDERICKDFVNSIVKVGKLVLRNPQAVARKNPLSLIQAVGMEGEIQNLMRRCAQHINKMASEGKQNNTLPTGKEESIIQKLTENTPHQEPIEGENTSLGEILSNNLLTQSLTSVSSDNSSSKEPNMENLLEDFENTFGKTQSQGKWYKNPWVIGGFVVVAFLAGGLAFWFFSGKKKEQQAKKKVNW